MAPLRTQYVRKAQLLPFSGLKYRPQAAPHTHTHTHTHTHVQTASRAQNIFADSSEVSKV